MNRKITEEDIIVYYKNEWDEPLAMSPSVHMNSNLFLQDGEEIILGKFGADIPHLPRDFYEYWMS